MEDLKRHTAGIYILLMKSANDKEIVKIGYSDNIEERFTGCTNTPIFKLLIDNRERAIRFVNRMKVLFNTRMFMIDWYLASIMESLAFELYEEFGKTISNEYF